MKPIFVLLLLLNLSACGGSGSNSDSSSPTADESTSQTDPLEEVILVTPEGDQIQTDLAYTPEDQQEGLQNVQPEDFSEAQGKLFFYLEEEARTFWMPNTYFDLDIIYLDHELKITEIVRDLEHYTGNVNSEIPRAPTITSRHVLEMKSSSEISDRLKVGDQFLWESQLTLPQTESEIRQQQ